MPDPFVHRRIVGFGDTDAAAIAYTGRFPDFMLDAVEAWFKAVLGTDWYRLNVDEGLGTPFVQLAMEFKSPVTPREALDIAVRARKGRSSLAFAVEARGAETGEHRFSGTCTCVFFDKATKRTIPIPERYAARIPDDEGPTA